MYLPCCWDQNSVTSPQNHRTISQTWQITVNLSTNTGLLKIYDKTPTLVEFHMIKCLGKEVSHSSSYRDISPLPSSLAKLLAKARGSKVLLGNKPLLSLSPFPSHLNFSRSGLASYSCCSPKLPHQIFRTTNEWKGFSLPLTLWVVHACLLLGLALLIPFSKWQIIPINVSCGLCLICAGLHCCCLRQSCICGKLWLA